MADLLQRKETHFVLWRPKPQADAPQLVIGEFQYGNPPSLGKERRFALAPVDGFDDLFAISAADCALTEGQVYHYWFEVEDTAPWRQAPGTATRVLVTDPFAHTVDWRLLSPAMTAPFTANDRQPAAVIKFRDGKLVAADPGGEEADWSGEASPATFAANNHLVIYEMPTAWSRISIPDDLDIGAGTFRDVQSLVDPNAPGANFDDLAITSVGRSYLTELGVNALELLPCTDSFYKREWGYSPTHYLAPDSQLGFPEEFSSPTANQDLAALVKACHANGIRFFLDCVMAFSQHEPYTTINFADFYIADPASTPDDPDARNSRPDHGFRNAWGGTLWRYAKPASGYDPVSGEKRDRLYPARQFMLTHIERWMIDFRAAGIRVDSVENVANWDFIQEFKDHARGLFRQRGAAFGLEGAADARMLVVGEELSLPMAMLTGSRLDGFWNDHFRASMRAALAGEADEGTFRAMIDCRALGFIDGAQAINYITSHDVEGYRRERLCTWLEELGFGVDQIEDRVKLAFACLLTAVGVPMIFAGEEFADEHDRFDRFGHITQSGGKQVDPVNYARLADPWRKRIFDVVSRLAQLRTSHPALGVNDTDIFHIDFDNGKRVIAWRRGLDNPVVVVANFSDSSFQEYIVPGWPAAMRPWREVTENRLAPDAGREGLGAWQAKVYEVAPA
jgi:pullulanase